MTNVDWTLMRPVLGGLDTLTNVHLYWSIDDLYDAHEALDIKAEIEQHAKESAG